jgi:hypothetical protein
MISFCAIDFSLQICHLSLRHFGDDQFQSTVVPSLRFDRRVRLAESLTGLSAISFQLGNAGLADA